MSSKIIYNLLTSKPHNKHYLDRYIKLIRSVKNEHHIPFQTESHHILPKSLDMFPEFSDFSLYPWNKIILTKRQHFIAHLILAKTFGGKQLYAFHMMSNLSINNTKINSTLYQKLNEQAIKIFYESDDGKKLKVILSNNMKEKWSDEEYKTKTSQNISKAMQHKLATDDIYRNKKIENAKNASSNDIVKEKIREKAFQRNSSKEYREMISEKTKDAMAKPETKQKIKTSIELRKQKIVICEFCSFTSHPSPGFSKFHGRNCKNNPAFSPVIISCPHCNLTKQKSNSFLRYHFKNCKLNPSKSKEILNP